MVKPYVALILANTIWGMAPPIFKYALENIPLFTLAFIRFFFASFIFFPWIFKKTIFRLSLREFIYFFLGSIFGITLNISFFFLGLEKAPSINASIIGTAGPVFLYFLSIRFLKEKINHRLFFGMVLALFGVLVIILGPVINDGVSFEMGQLVGNLFFILAVISAVFHTLVFKAIVKKADIFEITGISFFIGGLTFLPFALKELESWSFVNINSHGWIGIVFGTFFSSAIAYFLYNYSLTKIPAGEVGIFSYLNPVVTVLVAIPLLGEYPSAIFLVGALFVFLGILIGEGRILYHFPKAQKKVRS